MLCGFMFPLWGTKLIFLSYTYSAASTKRWSSDIYTVRSWGSHTHADTRAHTSQMQTERSYSEAHTHKQTHVGFFPKSIIKMFRYQRKNKDTNKHKRKMASTPKRCIFEVCRWHNAASSSSMPQKKKRPLFDSGQNSKSCKPDMSLNSITLWVTSSTLPTPTPLFCPQTVGIRWLEPHSERRMIWRGHFEPQVMQEPE